MYTRIDAAYRVGRGVGACRAPRKSDPTADVLSRLSATRGDPIHDPILTVTYGLR